MVMVPVAPVTSLAQVAPELAVPKSRSKLVLVCGMALELLSA